MEIKDILRKRRLELGLTMKDVARSVGVNEGTVSRWESGEIANMRRDKILAYAKALDISPRIIMGWSDTEDRLLDPDLEEIQKCFNKLNHEGRKQLLTQAQILVGNPDYTKDIPYKEKVM